MATTPNWLRALQPAPREATDACHHKPSTTIRGAMYALVMLGTAWATSCGDEEPPTAPPPPNRPPAAQGAIPAQVLKPGRTATVDAANYFSEPDGQPLTFSSNTSDEEVVSVSMLGSTATVLGEQPGEASVTVTARDPAGLTAAQNFEVTVEPFSDREILVLFHQATGGPEWFGSENWLTDAPLQDWFGIEVDDEGRVVRLELYRNNIAGPIPVELAGLSRLTHLELGSNHFTGAIPPELGELVDLSHLGFFNNRLAGPVPPELGNLSRLTWLEIERNALTGLIPRSFLELDRLNRFYFSDTNGLCAPGTPEFASWIAAMRGYEGPFCNQSDLAALASLYEASGGGGWTNADGWPGDAATAEWYGVSADSLGRVTGLDLSGNVLAGRLPENLGQLAHLTELRIDDNALSGRLPPSLSMLPLQELRYDGTELCAPPDSSFQTWLQAIPSHQGTGTECAPPSDREVLVTLYDATGGPNWAESENWLSEKPLRSWYGVRTDQAGRVTALLLPNNALAGPIPAELGELSRLRNLILWNNDLQGSIPAELGGLAHLTELILWNTGLTGNIPAELGNLGRLKRLTLGQNRLTGPIPAELGNLTSLISLALEDNALEGPVPAELGNLADLRSLGLSGNDLSGSIPAELGNLSDLSQLALDGNALTGAVPPELGNLVGLRTMFLPGNQLTGPIPAEIANLDSLFYLDLSNNRLSGPIPEGLGNLSELGYLLLSDNDLSGPIPAGLAGLSNTFHLQLSNNRLTGPIPAELGDLPNLRQLFADHNDLAGPLPPQLGRLKELRALGLTNNPGLSGPLPDSLTEMSELQTFVTGATDLCAPPDDAFAQWLAGIPKRRVSPCGDGGLAAAYLTQAVQSRAYPVPLIAGDSALLRVFLTAADPRGAAIPAVRARFFVGAAETYVTDIPSPTTLIPTDVDEGDLASSANAVIPGDVIQPGLEMVVDIDPDGVLDPALGVARRIPEAGRTAVDVRRMPVLDLTLIPFLLEQGPDSSILELTAGMAADPEGHELLFDTRTLLPVGDLEVTAHEPVVISSSDAFRLLGETGAIRAMEGGTGHYLGTMAGRITGARGVARLPGRISFSKPETRIIAHELGHNLSLSHAPCGGAPGTDPSFPEPDGSIGAWGYDFRSGKLVRPGRRDVMSYCEPVWISDFYFTNSLRFRLSDEADRETAVVATPARALLLWGGVNAEGEPFLEPAFVLDAPPSLPSPGSEYQLAGRDAGGGELFSLRFDMPVVADGDGSSSFTFTLPVQPGWAESLAGITLSGPGGSDTLDEETVRPMAILRDPRTGQVRAILRDLPPATQAARDAAGRSAERGLEVLVSLGIPGAGAWRR